jgi:hypothetical protein
MRLTQRNVLPIRLRRKHCVSTIGQCVNQVLFQRSAGLRFFAVLSARNSNFLIVVVVLVVIVIDNDNDNDNDNDHDNDNDSGYSI